MSTLKYSKEFVQNIFNLYNTGASYEEISSKVGVPSRCVQTLLYSRKYKKAYDLVVKPRKRIWGRMDLSDLLSDEVVIKIRKLAARRVPYAVIGAKFGITANRAYFAARFRYNHLNTIIPPVKAWRYSEKTVNKLLGII